MTPALDVQLRSALARFELPREPSLERVARGASHHTFRVQAGSLRAYLRVYATPDAKRAHREHALIRRVRSTGTLAPAPIEDRTGKTVVEHQGLVLALYEAMPGAQHEPATIGLSEAASAGRTLAELHQQTAALPDDGYLRWALDWDGDAWVKRLERIELDDGARAWGCFHDHHVWPLEQLYLAGNEAARRFIPHEPFRPFELRWRAVRQ